MSMRTPTTPIVMSNPISNNIFFNKFFNYRSYTPLTIACKVDEKSLKGVYTFGFGVSKYVLPSKSSIRSNNTFL